MGKRVRLQDQSHCLDRSIESICKKYPKAKHPRRSSPYVGKHHAKAVEGSFKSSSDNEIPRSSIIQRQPWTTEEWSFLLFEVLLLGSDVAIVVVGVGVEAQVALVVNGWEAGLGVDD